MQDAPYAQELFRLGETLPLEETEALVDRFGGVGVHAVVDQLVDELDPPDGAPAH